MVSTTSICHKQFMPALASKAGVNLGVKLLSGTICMSLNVGRCKTWGRYECCDCWQQCRGEAQVGPGMSTRQPGMLAKPISDEQSG